MFASISYMCLLVSVCVCCPKNAAVDTFCWDQAFAQMVFYLFVSLC